MNKKIEKLIVKAIFYRLFASVFIFVTAFIFTKKAEIAFLIGITEFIVKIILYFVYDVLWLKIENKFEGKNK